ncbi:MAG: hypothetical protein IPL88_03910 [Rhizobiales bacterium]|nr:hypothetical protein [Hyphomicrobiales bacterium]
MMATQKTRCSFDPELCPLLQGLSADEQARRMREDPMIRACLSSLDAPTKQMLACPGVRRPGAASAARACGAEPPAARREPESA